MQHLIQLVNPPMRFSEQLARILAVIFFVTTLILACVVADLWVSINKIDVPLPPTLTASTASALGPVSPLLLNYHLELPGRGEVFPALAEGVPADYWPVAVLSISNRSSRPAVQTISAELPQWSERQVKTVVIGPHQDVRVNLAPMLLPEALRNAEMRRIVLEIQSTGPDTGGGYVQTRPVYLHAASEIFWGKKFANAQYVARWVTPHDPSILSLVSRATRWMPAGRMPGYNSASSSTAVRHGQVRAQAEAVFRALKQSGISYVSSIFVFGNYINQAQRIRLPDETLSVKNANCMDVSVAFASAMENLGMEPVIVIVPGHAFAGVRLGPESAEILYLDLTVLPAGTFGGAIARAEHWRAKTESAQVITVEVAAARALGIYPM